MCEENSGLLLNDGCSKLFFNTLSMEPDIPVEVKQLFDYINSGKTSGEFTTTLENSVNGILSNERWRREYMHSFCEKQDLWNEALEKGIEQGREEGIVQGLSQGLEQGREEGLSQGLEQGREEGLNQGLEQGIRASIVLERKHQVANDAIVSDLVETYKIPESEAIRYVNEVK